MSFESDFEAKFRVTTQYLLTDVSFTGDRQGYTCISSEQNGNYLYEMHKDDIIFSANQGDNSMEGKDLQSRRLTARLNIPKRWFNYSRLSEKRKVHQDDFNSLKFIV